MDDARAQTAPEEITNAITHGIGAFVGVVGLFAAVQHGVWTSWSRVSMVATVAYVLSVITLFGASTAYHVVRSVRWKARLQKADHCAIYLLIAGTWTPFALVGLGGLLGGALLAVVWGLAVAGVALELSVSERWERVSLGLYLLMGWLGVVAIVPLIQSIPVAATILLAVGGVLYTGGIRFYTRDRPWDHAIWHGFVLGGALSHGAAVVLSVV